VLVQQVLHHSPSWRGGWESILCYLPPALDRVLRSRFLDIISCASEKRAELRCKLRKKQIELVLGGDRTMLVWVGKQYLGQSDKTVDVSQNLHEFKGAVIAAPDYSEKEKAALAKYRRQALGGS
jgi:hypothetical protein